MQDALVFVNVSRKAFGDVPETHPFVSLLEKQHKIITAANGVTRLNLVVVVEEILSPRFAHLLLSLVGRWQPERVEICLSPSSNRPSECPIFRDRRG